MQIKTVTIEDYWPALAAALPEFTTAEQRTAIALYRALAQNGPLTMAEVGDALGVSPAEAEAALAQENLRAFVYIDQGRLVGFGGLAAAPMHHEFTVDGRRLWTWCAWDSLFIPHVLGARADVVSPDPESGEPVRVTVSPDGIESAAPPDAVVSFLLPDAGGFRQTAQNVMANFCHFVFFFASPASGSRWQTTRPDTLFFSPGDAFELGRRLVEKQFGHALGWHGDPR